jgi:hypothetical protein
MAGFNLVEMLLGTIQLFPTMLTVTLFVVGIMVGRLPWVLVSLGGVVTAIIVLMLQYMVGKSPLAATFSVPGENVIRACSVIPEPSSGTYMMFPSLWTTVSTFFVTFIIVNASNILSQAPVRTTSPYALSVQHRKSVGMISILTTLVVFFILLGMRVLFTSCESVFGIVAGLILGSLVGYGWWVLLDACGYDVYPDIHGIMIGTRPGLIHNNPVACA